MSLRVGKSLARWEEGLSTGFTQHGTTIPPWSPILASLSPFINSGFI